jgi:hypothetical protein
VRLTPREQGLLDALPDEFRVGDGRRLTVLVVGDGRELRLTKSEAAALAGLERQGLVVRGELAAMTTRRPCHGGGHDWVAASAMGTAWYACSRCPATGRKFRGAVTPRRAPAQVTARSTVALSGRSYRPPSGGRGV